MFFQESEAIVRDCPDLLQVVTQVDLHLSNISGPAPLRPTDFASVLNADENQVASVFHLFSHKGVLRTEEMVECERCHNLMPATNFYLALEEEDQFECTSCSIPFRRRCAPIVIYRKTTDALHRNTPRAHQPVFDPPPTMIREHKFAAENGPRPELASTDFLLKRQIAELFAFFDERQNGVIDVLEIKHGLPFRMIVTEERA